MARYGEKFKQRAVARLLPPESSAISAVSQEMGISVATLERWRAEALSMPARKRVWTAAMDEAQLSAWCREQGVYPTELQQWKSDATAALTESTEERVSPQQAREDKKRIKELECDLRRKDKALAEAAALLVQSKQMEAIFRRGGDE